MARKPKKTLGILGGMGPAAAAEFLRIMAWDAPAECDQEHPRLLMISEPSIPDRTGAILEGGDDPTPLLRCGLEKLIALGAEVLAVPCNTAHYFIDRFRDDLPVPLIHIVEATILAARRRFPDGAWLLATSGTCKSGLYPGYARTLGYDFFQPDESRQQIIQQSLLQVKAGKPAEAGATLRAVVQKLWEERDIPVVTACTELPLAYAVSGLPAEREISSLKALSDACLEFLYGPELREN